MNALDLIESFSEFKEMKNIDRVTLMRVLEDVFVSILKKKYGTDEHLDVIVNPDKGDLEIWLNREIVPDGEVEDENLEIAYSDAIKIEEDFEIGEEVSEQINFADFGRRNILSLRQNLMSKILELEKENISKFYNDRIGEIVTGEVHKIWKREILILDDDGNELLLPKDNQIPRDYFNEGNTVRAVVEQIEKRNGTPVVILSRTSPMFLEKLFELEVPEVFDGLITVKKIVREPGERAKVTVESYDERVDPVGACVGMKGSRIHGIVRELKNEHIDVLHHTTNIKLLVQRSLGPAKIKSLDAIEILEEDKRINVYLQPDQVSLAIGRGGYNIKLASKLSGYTIDIYREGAEDIDDVDLDEFSDEIEDWVIKELKLIGCDTAKSVLNLTKEDLIRRSDLEEETIEDVLNILKSEFE